MSLIKDVITKVRDLDTTYYTVGDEEWYIEDKYELQQLLGKGAYGSVCKAWDAESNKSCAIKRIDDVLSNEIDALRILREIAILRRLKHPNIVQLVDVMEPDDEAMSDLYVVFEFGGTDLSKFIKGLGMSKVITAGQVKFMMQQLVAALYFMHDSKIIHRDLKPANILIDPSTFAVKVADFGLARVLAPDATFAVTDPLHDSPFPLPSPFSPIPPPDAPPSLSAPPPIFRQMSAHVVTRWYRAPEVILTKGWYSTAIDVWSLGAIFGEILNLIHPNSNRKPIFPGTSCFTHSPRDDNQEDSWMSDQRDQLQTIFELIGTPSPVQIDKLHADPILKRKLKSLEPVSPVNLRERFPHADTHAIDLFSRTVSFDPDSRPTMAEVAKHFYFADTPLANLTQKNNAARCLQRLDLESLVGDLDIESMIRREINRLHLDIDEIAETEKNYQEIAVLPPPPAVRRIFSDPSPLQGWPEGRRDWPEVPTEWPETHIQSDPETRIQTETEIETHAHPSDLESQAKRHRQD